MQLMTVTEVSQMLKVRKETVYAWIKQGELACIRLDRLVRVDEETSLTSLTITNKGERNEQRKINNHRYGSHLLGAYRSLLGAITRKLLLGGTIWITS